MSFLIDDFLVKSIFTVFLLKSGFKGSFVREKKLHEVMGLNTIPVRIIRAG